MSNDKQPPRSEDARQAQRTARRRRRRRQRILRICILLSALLVFALIVAFIVLRITGTVAKNNGEKTSFLAVRDIIVEGDTRYSTDEIIRESGIYVGESLLVVNKVQAHDRLLEKFPYLDRVEVGNASFSTIQIRVWETQVIGAVQTYDYFEMIQDRILSFVSGHSQISYERLRSLMLNTEMMTKDLGTVLVGGEAVQEGLIDECGGIREAFAWLNRAIDGKKQEKDAHDRMTKTDFSENPKRR